MNDQQQQNYTTTDDAKILTRQEVIQRRSLHLRQLARHYKDHYWSLVEQIAVKIREYEWNFGMSPVERRTELAEGTGENTVATAAMRGACGVDGCKGRPMPLTAYCYDHILCDGRQMLYKPCGYRIERGQTGSSICGRPVLKATMPSLCTMHHQMTKTRISQTLKKAGLTILSSGGAEPGLHVIIAEYIKHIQLNRKEVLNAIKNGNATEDDNAG